MKNKYRQVICRYLTTGNRSPESLVIYRSDIWDGRKTLVAGLDDTIVTYPKFYRIFGHTVMNYQRWLVLLAMHFGWRLQHWHP